jgi:methylase of polypeptide subunit release factors
MNQANTLAAVLHRGVERLQPFPNGRRDAQQLLLRVLQRDGAWLLAHPEATLNDEQASRYDDWIGRRGRRAIARCGSAMWGRARERLRWLWRIICHWPK